MEITFKPFLIMKSKFLSIIAILGLSLSVASCHDPEDYAPTDVKGSDECFESFRAYFPDQERGDENEFFGEIDYTNHTICVVFPYNYPRLSENVLTDQDIQNMRIMCNLKTSVRIEPAVTFMDLSKDNYITVIDGYGTKTQFRVWGEVRKSADCAITSFKLIDDGIDGIINEDTKIINLISAQPINPQLAEFEISHGATISPNPAEEALNYSDIENIKLTVTAQDGETQAVYTFTQGTPEKISAGMRAGSERMIWAKKIGDIGLNASGVHAGLGVLEDYIVVNEVGRMQAVYLDRKNGNPAGTIDISAVGDGNNYFMTSDDNNTILINSNSNDGPFTIWTMKGLSGNPTKLLTCSSAYQVGNKVSVTGDMDGDAVITATLNGTGLMFYKWTVRGGQLQSQTPETVNIPYYSTIWGNSDADYVSAASSSDFFVAGYGNLNSTGRRCAWYDSAGTLKTSGNEINANWVENAIDHCTFNKIGYVAHNSVNTFTWGADDCLYMYDTSSSNLTTNAVDFTDTGMAFNTNYGAAGAGNRPGLAGNANDVRLRVSANGFYMYLYFQFAKGYVGCIQVDCIDMGQ